MNQEKLSVEFSLKMTIVASFLGFFFYDIFYLFIFEFALSVPLLIVTTFLILNVLVYILYQKKRYRAAKWSILILLVVTIYALVFHALGPKSGVHYYFLAWSIIPLVIFRFQRIIFWIVYALINISLFIWAENFLDGAGTQVFLTDHILFGLKSTSIFFTMCVISFTIWILYISLRQKEKEITQQSHDLQDLNRLQEEHLKTMKEQQERLVTSNATKDKLFSIIAHDLRSPFNNILGFSEILIETLKELKTEEVEEYLLHINLSARNTHYLLENLLDWAKTQSDGIVNRPKEIDLWSLINDTIFLSKTALKFKNITLEHTQEEKIQVFADENMLKTVLRNLISNAIKFTNYEGIIKVSAVTIGKQIDITISDNGVGMGEPTRKRLFDIITNTTSHGTSNEDGSGLGLILCKEFVDRLGGSISVESQEGKGSDFKVMLPLNN